LISRRFKIISKERQKNHRGREERFYRTKDKEYDIVMEGIEKSTEEKSEYNNEGGAKKNHMLQCYDGSNDGPKIRQF
jgi:hypothetical protein